MEYLRQVDNTIAKLYLLTFFISITASILSLIALSVDRDVAITQPLKYRKYLSWLRCRLISFGIWFISLTMPFLYFKIGFCDYFMFYANTGIFIASVTMVFTYFRTHNFLRKHTEEMKSPLAGETLILKRLMTEKRITNVLLIVLILSWRIF